MHQSSLTPRLLRSLLWMLLLPGITHLGGCAMFGWKQEQEPLRVVEDASHPIAEILCLWEPAEGHDMNGLPCRGFAGQILFFIIGNEVPAETTGDVTIYVFDDHGTTEEQSRPLHIFEFPAEAWQTYLRRANLGATYQVFIPYTRRTSEEAECTLRVRYRSPEGRTTYSRMARIDLPGTRRRQPRQTPPAHRDITGESVSSPTAEYFSQQLPASGGSLAQAYCNTPACSDPRFSFETPRAASEIELASSRIVVPSTHQATQQLSTLERLVNSLGEVSEPALAETRPRPGLHVPQGQPVNPPARQAETPSPSDQQGEPPAARHRLHPLADF